MKKFVFVLVGSVCLLAAPPAQAQIGIGPHVGWSDEFDLGIAEAGAHHVPGAGGVVAGNHVHNVASPDGLTIGFFPAGNILLDLVRVAGVEFDSRKFHWIGTASSDVGVCLARHDSGFKTISDVIRSAKPFVIGGGGPGTTFIIHPKALNAVLGTNFNVIPGYVSVPELYAAMERGEVSGMCGILWSSLKAARPEWVPKGFVHILLQMGLEKHPEVLQVPWVMDLVEKRDDRLFLETIFAPLAMARPFFVRPEVPRERVAILREAFMKTLKDSTFLREAERAGLEISPSSGEEVQSLVEKVFATPPEIVHRIAKLLK
jgi:tripartite-type tricarboxylate transporter receptor subunit TctC